MTDTFNWRVHATASGGGDFMLTESRFGDGYRQSAPFGLNNEEQKWSVTVSGSIVDEVLAFIRAHKGASFFWTPPKGDQGYYICKRYSPSDQGSGYFTLSLEFEQVFFP